MSAPSLTDLFVHHVLFYTKASASEAEKAKLLEGLQTLTDIPSIKMIHIGTPAQTNRDVIERTYIYSLLCIFESAADEQIYQEHPTHDDFRNQYASYWDKVVIYDSIGSMSYQS